MDKVEDKGAPFRAKPLMIQGTASHVGKSIITAAMLRILRDRSFSAAPFKPQNMALNSAVTADGGEIGRAQAFQALAAGVEPTVDMNPILLKPTADQTSQVIIQGRVHSNMSAREYHLFKKEAMRAVLESYGRLASSYDALVIEGAGSPAEINLRENDIANMGTALAVKSPVVIVADIDRGGVFASIVGTMELLAPEERALVKGFIINKFRGDATLLKPGLDFLEEKTSLPVLGVVPWMDHSMLPDEDGVVLEGGGGGGNGRTGGVRVAVVKLPRVSNFTDLDPFVVEDKVTVDYITTPEALAGAHMVVVPGSKNTMADLEWMKERGLDRAIKEFAAFGGTVVGICGGFQMFGRTVGDPHGVESVNTGRRATVAGLGLLDCTTVMAREKTTRRVKGRLDHPLSKGTVVDGYEIHMGETVSGERPFAVIEADGNSYNDGAISKDGRLWGTYIHGVFDNDLFRRAIVDSLGQGGAPGAKDERRSFTGERERAVAALAATVGESLHVDAIIEMMGLGEEDGKRRASVVPTAAPSGPTPR